MFIHHPLVSQSNHHHFQPTILRPRQIRTTTAVDNNTSRHQWEWHPSRMLAVRLSSNVPTELPGEPDD